MIKILMIWSTVPEIEQNIPKLVILGHFLPFYPLKTPKLKILKNEKICWRYHHFTRVPKITIIWCMVPEIWSATDRIFCHYGPFFALLPPYGPKKSKFWKNEKTLEDIIILQMFTINDCHMIYGFSDMDWNRQNFLSFWTVFCPFTLLTTLKTKILKNWIKPLEKSLFYTSAPKIMIICYTVP